jgi:hypothetical protein
MKVTNRISFVFALNTRLIFLLFAVQVILSIVQIFIPIWIAAVNSLVIFYLIPGIILTTLFVSYSISIIELLSFSIIASSLAIPVITMIIGCFYHSLRYWHYASGILAFSLAIALARIKLRTKTADIILEREHIIWLILVLASTIGASGFLFFMPPHTVTPDENFHLNAAYAFLEQGKIFPIGYDILSSTLSTMLTSRAIVTIQFASFIASLPTWSVTTVNLSSLFFLFGLLIVSSHLMYEVNRKDSKLLMAVPLVIASNPLLLMLSSYALTDLALAFYTCAFSLFFVKSLESSNDGIHLNYLEFFRVLAVVFIIILLKPNLALIILAIIIYLYFAFKYKWYKIRFFKILLMIFFIIISFSIFLDFYRHMLIFFLGMDKASIPVRLTYNILPFSFLDMMFNLGKGFSSLRTADYLWILYVILSPQNLSLIGLSCLVLSAINLFMKNIKFRLKLFSVLFWGAVAISYVHALTIGYDSWIVIRYYAFLIPLAVVLILGYIDRITSHSNILHIAVVSIIMLLGTIFLSESYGRLPYSYMVISNKVVNFSITMFHTLLLCIFLLVALFAQYHISLRITFFNRVIISLKITGKRFIQAVCILLLIASNMSFAVSAFRYSPSFQYPELSYLPSIISAGDFVISNYYGIGSYIRNNYLSAIWIMPPPKEEFESLITGIPEGSKLFIFKKGGFSIRTDNYIGDYFTNKVFFKLYNFNVNVFHFQKAIGDLYEISQIKSKKTVSNYVKSNYTKPPTVSYSWYVDTVNAISVDDAYVILNITLESEHEELVTIIISTETFSRVYTFLATAGNNSVILRFKNSFNGLQYGSIISRMSRLIVLDDEGRILLDDVVGIHVFSLSDVLCYCLLISIALLILLIDFSILFTKKQKDGRDKNHLNG